MELSDLNWFDITVITIVLISSLLAFFRGFIKALFSLVTWVGSATSAYYFYPRLNEYLKNFIASETASEISSIVIVFLLTFIILAIINSKLLYLVRHYRKGFVDKTLGLGFGFARGLLIVCLFYYSMDTSFTMIKFGGKEIDGEQRYGPSFFVEAKTYNLLKYSTKIILAVLPDDTPEKLAELSDKYKERLLNVLSDGGESDGLPRALNDEELKMIAKIRSAIPESEYDKIKEKYNTSSKELSELDKLAIFRDILSAYKNSASENKISEEDKISNEKIELLDKVLNGTKIDKKELPQDEGTGYKELNIKQLDRLVDTVNE
jgi:membrane protein required for colicin V production